MSVLNKEEFQKLPRFVSMRGIALRLTLKGMNEKLDIYDCVYYRDAGDWNVDFPIKEGKMTSQTLYKEMTHMTGHEMVPMEFKEWEKQNDPYIYEDVKRGYDPRAVFRG